MKLVYVNADAHQRDIPVPGGWLTVTAGEPFDIADDIGESLLDQSIFVKADTAEPKEKK